MRAIDHVRKGQELLAQSQRPPASALRDDEIPVAALLAEQARAHFAAAQTLLQALQTYDMPADDYEEWQELASGPRKPRTSLRDLELDSCDECETTGRNCAAHGGRPGIPAGGESRG